MVCICGNEMTWKSDIDLEQYYNIQFENEEQGGIVSFYSCPCGVSRTIINEWGFDTEEEE